MYLKPSSNLHFIDNQALSVGVGSYTGVTRINSSMHASSMLKDKGTISVEFVNNTAAGGAGNSLCVGYINDDCIGFYGLDTGGIAALQSIKSLRDIF